MDLNKVYVYRMTHIENIPHIIQNGITHKNSLNANLNYKAIGDNSLIGTRDVLEIPNGKRLGDYIPFYFGMRTPMLYVVQNGFNGVNILSPEKIVYCVTSLRKISDSDLHFIYTDGHATDGFTKFYTSQDLLGIENQIDFSATNAKYWIKDDDLDFKRRKEAELLVEEDIPFELLLGFITYNENSKSNISEFGVEDKKIVIKPNYYF